MLKAEVKVEAGKMERSAFISAFDIQHSALPGINKGGSNSVVESQPSKLLVAGSIPVSRSNLRSRDTRGSYGWQAMELRRLSAGAPRSGAQVDRRVRSKVVWGS